MSIEVALNPQGVYICAGGTMPQFFQAILLGRLMSKDGGKKLGSMGIAKVNPQDLAFLAGLLEEGKIKPIIDRSFPLSETAEAVRYVEEKHARGKVVITMA